MPRPSPKPSGRDAVKPGGVASKLPWSVGGHPRDKSGSDWREITYQSEFGTTYMGQALKEDADLIVKAVNAYAPMRAALEMALIEVKAMLECLGGCDHAVNICQCETERTLEAIKEALKLAGQED